MLTKQNLCRHVIFSQNCCFVTNIDDKVLVDDSTIRNKTIYTVEPHYNKDLGTVKITKVPYYIRCLVILGWKKQRNILTSWKQQIYHVISELFIKRFHCTTFMCIRNLLAIAALSPGAKLVLTGAADGLGASVVIAGVTGYSSGGSNMGMASWIPHREPLMVPVVENPEGGLELVYILSGNIELNWTRDMQPTKLLSLLSAHSVKRVRGLKEN